jgi:hypothetical protein
MKAKIAISAALAFAALAASPPARAQVTCPPGPDQLSVTVTENVTFDAASGLYTYAYEVVNAATSAQPMDSFAIVDFAPPVTKVASPPGWFGTLVTGQNTVAWVAFEVSDPDTVADAAAVPASIAQVPPGGVLGGFSFQSPKPPGPVSFRATGFAPLPVQMAPTDAAAELLAESLLERCPNLAKPTRDVGVTGATTGPVNFIRVTIDLKPGSTVHPVNPRSQGVLPVAILGTATFDVRAVDQTSVRLGRGAAAPRHGGHFEDVNGDGIVDLVFQFPTPLVGILCGDTSVALTGKTVDGTPIAGSDSLVTVGCR